METPGEQFKDALTLTCSEFGVLIDSDQFRRLVDYYELLLKWNPRLHLVAPCPPEEFAVRHVLESLLLLKYLPRRARLADVGTGSGLPIIPCLLMRDDLEGVLIESSQRKAAFLREAMRPIDPPERARLIAARFEEVPAPKVEFITCRALDRFNELLPKIVEWAPANATFLLFAGELLLQQISQLLDITQVERIPRAAKRVLVAARAKPK